MRKGIISHEIFINKERLTECVSCFREHKSNRIRQRCCGNNNKATSKFFTGNPCPWLKHLISFPLTLLASFCSYHMMHLDLKINCSSCGITAGLGVNLVNPPSKHRGHHALEYLILSLKMISKTLTCVHSSFLSPCLLLPSHSLRSSFDTVFSDFSFPTDKSLLEKMREFQMISSVVMSRKC